MWEVNTPEQEKDLRHKIYTMVRPLALRVNFDKIVNDTDDIVQIVEMTIYRFGNQFRGETQAEFQAWLRQIVYLTVLQLRRKSRLKKRRNVTVPVDLDGLNSPEDQEYPQMPIDRLIFNEDVERLRQALTSLAPHENELIRLHVYEGLSFQRMAERLGRSPSGTRYNYDLAIKRLIFEYNKDPDAVPSRHA